MWIHKNKLLMNNLINFFIFHFLFTSIYCEYKTCYFFKYEREINIYFFIALPYTKKMFGWILA